MTFLRSDRDDTVIFEDNKIGRMKKRIFEASIEEVDAILAEFGMPAKSELTEADTILIQKSIKNASRVVRTEHTEKVLEMENRGATLEELLPMISGRRGVNTYATGDTSRAPIAVGQIVGLIDDCPTVKEIVDGIIAEATTVMQRLRNIGVAG